MKKGGSSRFSTPMRPTGGDSDVFLDKSSKKEKLRRLSCVGIFGEMDKLSHSISTNSTIKRVKLPNKFSDHCDTINHASAPRKQRSAMKKRQHESQKNCEATVSTVSPGSRNEIGVRLKECTKKHKADLDDYEDSKMPKRDSILTKDEEEVAEALFAMAQACNSDHNGTSKVEPSSKPGLLVHGDMEPPDDTNGVKKSRERFPGHIYICHFIKSLQTTDDGSNRRGCVNVTSDVNQQKTMNGCTNQHKGFDTSDMPKTMREDASTQVEDLMSLHPTNTQNHHLTPEVKLKQVLPYFNTMEQNHLTESVSKQQSWGKQAGCSVETFGLKYTQAEHGLNKGKMALGEGPSSGYEKRSLFFVESGPTLELTL